LDGKRSAAGAGRNAGGGRKKRWEKGHFDNVIRNYRQITLHEKEEGALDDNCHHLDDDDDDDDDVVDDDDDGDARCFWDVVNRCRSTIRNITGNDSMEFMPPHILHLRPLSSSGNGDLGGGGGGGGGGSNDLGTAGVIRPHIDSVKFSGDVVAGISLVSERVMRLRPGDIETGSPLWQGCSGGREEEEDDGDGDWIDLRLGVGSFYFMGGRARYEWTHEIREVVGGDGGCGERISIVMRDVHKGGSN